MDLLKHYTEMVRVADEDAVHYASVANDPDVERQVALDMARRARDRAQWGREAIAFDATIVRQACPPGECRCRDRDGGTAPEPMAEPEPLTAGDIARVVAGFDASWTAYQNRKMG